MIVNTVTTVHGKNAERTFDNWQKNKLLRYVNTDLARKLPTTYGIEFASMVQEAQRANPNILTEADFVKKDGIQFETATPDREGRKLDVRLKRTIFMGMTERGSK